MSSSERERTEERLSLLEALVTATERRTEVLDSIANAPDTEQAQAALEGLLGINEVQARAVLDAQLRLFTVAYRSRIARERDEVQDWLSQT